MPIKITYGHVDEGTGQVEPMRERLYGDPDATDEPTGQTEPARVIEHVSTEHTGEPTGQAEPRRVVTTSTTWPEPDTKEAKAKAVQSAENKGVSSSTATRKKTARKSTRKKTPRR